MQSRLSYSMFIIVAGQGTWWPEDVHVPQSGRHSAAPAVEPGLLVLEVQEMSRSLGSGR